MATSQLAFGKAKEVAEVEAERRAILHTQYGEMIEFNIKLRVPSKLIGFWTEVARGENPEWTVQSESNYQFVSSIIEAIINRDSVKIIEEDSKVQATVEELFHKHGLAAEAIARIDRDRDLIDAIIRESEAE